jgi:hypothetical protein
MSVQQFHIRELACLVGESQIRCIANRFSGQDRVAGKRDEEILVSEKPAGLSANRRQGGVGDAGRPDAVAVVRQQTVDGRRVDRTEVKKSQDC